MRPLYVSKSLRVKSEVGLVVLDAQTPLTGFPAPGPGDKKVNSRPVAPTQEGRCQK